MARFMVGFEREFFTVGVADGVVIPAHTVMTGGMYDLDGCGLIAEARGEPAPSAMEAAYKLLYAQERLAARTPGMIYLDATRPHYKFTKKQIEEARRQFTKGVIAYRNLRPDVVATSDKTFAALHVSITMPVQVSYPTVNSRGKVTGTSSYTANRLFDFPFVFSKLDKLYAAVIKAAGRQTGFYEIKDGGRIEYRSLPASVDVVAVAKDIDAILQEM